MMRLEGLRFGKYSLVRLLKKGGMGEVYLAQDTKIYRQVAIKVIRTDTVSYADEQEAREASRLFLREVQVVANLRHEHILPLYDVSEEFVSDMTLLYMVMPLCEEGSLADWLYTYNRGHTLSPRFVGFILKQAASALQYAHEHNIVHLDVKLSNFLVRDPAQHPDQLYLQLADFGVAKLMTTTSQSQIIRGTPSHMAPEQWAGRAVPASDQYALAVMCHELLTGQPLFEGDNQQQMWYQHSNIVPDPPSKLNPTLPVELDDVICRALAKTPQERYPSILAFAHAFRQALHDAGNIAHLPPTIISPESNDEELLTPRQRRGTSIPKVSLLLGLALMLIIGSTIAAALTFQHFSPGLGPDGTTPVAQNTHVVTSTIGSPTSNLTATARANATATAQSRAAAQAQAANATATVMAEQKAAATATAIAQATATAHAQATATVEAYNALEQAGTLSFTDPLQDNSTGLDWDTTYLDGSGGCQFTGGAYLSSALISGHKAPCYAHSTSYSNFFCEVTLKMMQGDRGGIMFRGDEVNGNFYYFYIDADGKYALDVYLNDTFDHTVINGTSPKIDKTPGHANLLAIQADGSKLTLFVNDSYVNSVNDTTFSQGEIGLMASSVANPTIVSFSNAGLHIHP